MTKMTEPVAHPVDLESVVGRYVAVWSEADPGSRRTAVAGLWAPEGVEFVEGAQFRGHDELEARIAEAYWEFVASGSTPSRLRMTRPAITTSSRSLFS